MAVLGRAYIEIHADTKPFNKELGKKVSEALGDAQPSVDKAGQKAGEKYADQFGDAISAQLPRIGNRFRNGLGRDGVNIPINIDPGSERRARGRLSSLFSSLFSGASNNISRLFSSALARGIGNAIQTGLGGLSSSFLGFGGGGGAAGIVGGIALLEGFAAIAGAVLAAINVLVSLSGVLLALPGIITAAALALGVFQLILADFGTEDATGAAKAVYKEFEKFKKLFDSLRILASKNFFGPLKGDLDAIRRAYEKVLTGAVIGPISSSLGFFFHELAQAAANPDVVRFIEVMGRSTAKFIREFAPAVSDLLVAIANAGTATLPFYEQLVAYVLDGIGKLTGFFEEVSRGGRSEFLQDTLNTLDQIFLIVQSLFNFLGAVWAGNKEATQGVLKNVREMIDSLTTFFESENGKAFARQLLGAFVLVLDTIVVLVIWTGNLIGAFQRAVEWVSKLIGKIDGAADKAQALAGVVGNIGGALINNLGGGLPGFAAGGIVTGPTVATLGESGAEAVIPLNNPQRARQVAAEAGLFNMGGGGAGAVYVYIGNEQIDAYIDRRTARGINALGTAVASGPRMG